MNTPETNAAVIASKGQWSFVLKETCERLERERDEAQNKLRLEKLTTISQKEEIEILRQQLIEARSK